MSKLSDTKQTIFKASELIEGLMDELKFTRNLLNRMILLHGGEMQQGDIQPPETLDFRVISDNKIEAKDYVRAMPGRFFLLDKKYKELMK